MMPKFRSDHGSRSRSPPSPRSKSREYKSEHKHDNIEAGEKSLKGRHTDRLVFGSKSKRKHSKKSRSKQRSRFRSSRSTSPNSSRIGYSSSMLVSDEHIESTYSIDDQRKSNSRSTLHNGKNESKNFKDGAVDLSLSEDCEGFSEDKIKSNSSSARSEDKGKRDQQSEICDGKFYAGKSENKKDCDTSQSLNISFDWKFDFKKYRYSLGKIFFNDRFFSKISERGSQEYEDFWAFVKRYQDFQLKKQQKMKKSAPEQPSSNEKEKSLVLGLPIKYDVQYKINISLLSKEFDVFLKKNRLVDHQLEKELTREKIFQFRTVLIHFLDFQQKQKFQKLHKIRHDQRNLPIYHYRHEIIETLKHHQIIVVAGDTGCGKSTQVPQYLMEAGYEKIACTQPRRIACISLSKRVGYETLNEYGSQVAYQVRFEKSKTAATKILFLTEGLLLRQMTTDPLLEIYNVIVIDEVHERHIFTDFLLGVLKCVLMQRKDLKLVLMSATINIDLFSGYFNNAPVIKVPGRLYPIELEYCPITRDDVSDSRRLDATPYLRIMQRIDHKYPSTERGDLLIFLSGMSEIMSVVEAARAYAQQMKRWIVMPLHSALSVEEQDKVFDVAPEGVRKCIVSTNIAETSVTIDGVRFIVDSGKVKEMSFDAKYKMQRLQEFWISRASSEQRKGRAGRTGPGVCYRLYDESDYNDFQDYSTPELQRVPLDSLVLQMISMGLPNARKFPFIEPPSMSSLENSIEFLKEQGALASNESLTPIGQMLSMLPVDVVIGKMLIMGSIFNMIDPILSITAAMSVQSPFTNKAYTDSEAMTARKPLESDHGDPFTLLNAFDEWIHVKAQGQGTRKWSKRRGLEEQRFYEMTKLKRQFQDLLKDHHLLDRESQAQHHLSSDQRRAQHGERKRLAQLRREKMRERKRRKVLTLEDEEFKISDDEVEGDGKDNDIKDLEFRLSNDLGKLQETSNQSRSFTLHDVTLVKIILCSGLYPQVAIADECNTYKRDSEQAFHTKSKPFLLLHPTSTFAANPDVLMPKDAGGKRPAPSDLKGLMSSKHELLSYVSLLETNNKPYLVNTMRVPALQTVTLFSNCIDSNSDCTRLLCDGWLELKFPDPETAEKVISSVLTLRSTWEALLQVRLHDTFEGIEEERRVSPRAKQLERLLASKLTEFLTAEFVYAVRRVLPAETQRAYLGPGRAGGEAVLQAMLTKGKMEAREDPIKGGVLVTDYFTYNCLLDEASAEIWGSYTQGMQKHWTCPSCNTAMVVSVFERLQHQASCNAEGGEGLKASEMAEEEKNKAGLNHNRKSYHCETCGETLQLTTTEILRHRRSHMAGTSSKDS